MLYIQLDGGHGHIKKKVVINIVVANCNPYALHTCYSIVFVGFPHNIKRATSLVSINIKRATLSRKHVFLCYSSETTRDLNQGGHGVAREDVSYHLVDLIGRIPFSIITTQMNERRRIQ